LSDPGSRLPTASMRKSSGPFDEERFATAMHEAAHAVIAVVVGLRVDAVSVELHFDSAVSLRVGPDAQLSAGIHALLAGPLAEYGFRHRGFPDITWRPGRAGEQLLVALDAYGGSIDVRNAIKQAAEVSADAPTADQFLVDVTASTEEMLWRPDVRGAIGGVAHELMAKGRLSGLEFHRLVPRKEEHGGGEDERGRRQSRLPPR
jgi:hypothetical protein